MMLFIHCFFWLKNWVFQERVVGFILSLKALFVLQILKVLSWCFGYVEKAGWLKGSGQFQNVWTLQLG